MSAQVEAIVSKYRALAQIPALINAELLNKGSAINSVWSQRNLEREKTTKSLVRYVINPDYKLIDESNSIDVSSELLSKLSPTERFRSIIREQDNKDGRKQYLEIWKKTKLIRCVDVTALEIHNDIYTDGEFGVLEWSPDETKLLYVAEKKISKSEPFYKRKPNSEKGDNVKGQEHLYKQDWGEQLVGKKQSVLAIYELEEDAIKLVEGIPEDVCPAQPIWGPNGVYIIGVSLKSEPRKLGLIYCTNRLSTIFSVDLDGSYVELPLANKAVKCPRLTPDGKNIVWLQRYSGGPHASAVTLVKTTLPISQTSEVCTIVDIIDTKKDINGKNFYGLYNSSLLNKCWASNRRLLLSTIQQNYINSYIINIDTGNIIELPHENGSQIILDVKNDIVLMNRRSFLTPDVLCIGKLPAEGNESNMQWTEVTETNIPEQLVNSTYEYLEIKQDSSDEINDFTAIYLGPKTAPEKSIPLIVWPHGGPHSAFANCLFQEASLFLSVGYALLLVNFRGSIGAGQKSVEYLLGRVGKSDVSDCVLATKQALDKFCWLDNNRIVLVGGSHGGFLVTHLSGQYPDMFKAVVARNPVIDIASMSITSDIPDWCFIEATGTEYTQIGESNDAFLLAMRRASPIQHAHKVKAPTLLQIGCNDLRVPCSQAIDYYHRLRANGVIVQMNLYEDNHPLGSVPNEMDNLINTVLWIEKHLNKSVD